MLITVFGTGYVGLVTGACLADVGHEVLCVDVDEDKIQALRSGRIPFYEPGLDTLVKTNATEGRLRFTTSAEEGVAFGELQFIAVGTPPDEDGSADLKYVLAVAKSIGKYMRGYKIVIDKSTVPVGTAERVRQVIREALNIRGANYHFDVCANPEFLKEGAAIDDFTRGARIIIGTDSETVRTRMRECYGPYNRNHDKIMFMDARSAELTKYAANAMLATKISFMNEMANLAERLGADIEQVRQGIGSDPRIGYHFIYAGCGYGGSCFPKDVQALIRIAADTGYRTALINAVEDVNNRQKQVLYNKLSQAFNGDLRGKCVAIWGLAFKPNTDDMRDAPSRVLMESLWASGVNIRAYDPAAMNECRRIYGERADLVLVQSKDEAVRNADALIICTEWKEFRTLNASSLKKQLSSMVIIDGRNLFEENSMIEQGFEYYSIGRPRHYESFGHNLVDIVEIIAQND